MQNIEILNYIVQECMARNISLCNTSGECWEVACAIADGCGGAGEESYFTLARLFPNYGRRRGADGKTLNDEQHNRTTWRRANGKSNRGAVHFGTLITKAQNHGITLPKECHADRQQWKPKPQKPQKPTYTPPKPFNGSVVPRELITRSEWRKSRKNTLFDYLARFICADELQQAAQMYHVGTTKDGGVLFPQIDEQGRCRSGKVMHYLADGHRDRARGAKWLHAYPYGLALPDGGKGWELEQCLFGLHLIADARHSCKVVGIVEGEKTALLCSLLVPDVLWMACGGLGLLNADKLFPLRGRRVVVFPDADGAEDWKKKAAELAQLLQMDISCSNWAKNEGKGSHRDIADKMLEELSAIVQNKNWTIVGQLDNCPQRPPKKTEKPPTMQQSYTARLIALHPSFGVMIDKLQLQEV